MSDVMTILRKRDFWPVDCLGDIIHFRTLRQSEIEELIPFRAEDESLGYALGCGMLQDDRSQVFTRNESETAKDFGARVLKQADLSSVMKARLTEVCIKLVVGTINHDDLKKN